MYNSNQQPNTMNLLISPFTPNQAINDNTEPNQTDNYIESSQTYNYTEPNQTYDFIEPTLQYASATPPIQQQNILYNQSPSPQFEMMNNEFISNSPESSSSIESNLISPPQQYYPSDFSWPESIGFTQSLASRYNRHPATKRSASVPPHFHKFKPGQQDSMYNQFQVTPGLNPMMNQSSKPLPIKIPRMNTIHGQFNRPMNKEAHKRQLDQKLEKINFDDITVAELKEALRERGLSATGRKAELLNRLKAERDLLLSHGKTSSPLHRRVTNLNLSDSSSPTRRNQRLYAPYSPPPLLHGHRLASSVPESNTHLFLNDQYMKKPSCLRKSIDEEEQKKDIWDDQTLQEFLNQI